MMPGHPYKITSINNYISRQRTKLTGLPNLCDERTLITYCESKSVVPDGLDEPFLVRLFFFKKNGLIA
jgi:hypothetical protein